MDTPMSVLALLPALLLFASSTVILSAIELAAGPSEPCTYNNRGGVLADCADPFVFRHQGKYYLYVTSSASSRQGIRVYESRNLVNWFVPAGARNGLALAAGDVWGNRNFWSGDVVEKGGRFYLYATVDEHLVAAVSNSPCGPFRQAVKRPMHADIREIDGSAFLDDDGKAYLYFVRFDRGNVLYVAELADDMLTMKEDTIRRCFGATEPWELGPHAPRASVTEGAFCVKHKGWYYLIYTANHYMSVDYSVGYALSKSPTGPWTKYAGNPVLKATEEIKGPGNGMIVPSPSGKDLMFVYHAHCSTVRAHPRKLCMDQCYFRPDPDGGPDLFVIDGPTSTDQPCPR